MNPIDLLAERFKRSFEDRLLTKAERDELLIAIAEAGLDQRKRDILRSKVFDIAREGSGSAEMGFTLEWLEDASRVLEAKLEGQGPATGSRVYFSPGNDCLDAIVTVIESATKSLDVCVFTISDNRISDALIERKRRGVKLRILTDNSKLLDAGSDIIHLDEAGVEIRVDHTEYHMHHKFLVADNRVVVTGSYNWTRSAAEKNQENVLVTEEKVVVQRYRQEFDRMWPEMAPFK